MSYPAASAPAPRERRPRRYVQRLTMLALGVFLLIYCVPVVPYAWQADRGGGTPGTFVAKEWDCRRRACPTSGDWTSADGKVTFKDVRIFNRIPIGSSVAAVGFPDSGSTRVLRPDANNTLFWGFWALVGLGSIVMAFTRHVR